MLLVEYALRYELSKDLHVNNVEKKYNDLVIELHNNNPKLLHQKTPLSIYDLKKIYDAAKEEAEYGEPLEDYLEDLGFSFIEDDYYEDIEREDRRLIVIEIGDVFGVVPDDEIDEIYSLQSIEEQKKMLLEKSILLEKYNVGKV